MGVTVKLSNGASLHFEGTPSQSEIEEAARIHGDTMLHPKDANYGNEITMRKAALNNGVNPDLGSALTKQESGFNPHAHSGAGAYGMGQVTIPTARTYGMTGTDDEIRSQLMNPEINANLSMKILGDHLRKYGNVDDALVAYNAGPGKVGHKNLPTETVNYVKSINGMLDKRGTEDWNTKSNTKPEWMSNPPEGSTAAKINANMRYGNEPNTSGSYIQNQMSQPSRNQFTETGTENVPQASQEAPQEPQQPQTSKPMPSLQERAQSLQNDVFNITRPDYDINQHVEGAPQVWMTNPNQDTSASTIVGETGKAISQLPVELANIGVHMGNSLLSAADWATGDNLINYRIPEAGYGDNAVGNALAPQTEWGKISAKVAPYLVPFTDVAKAAESVPMIAEAATKGVIPTEMSGTALASRAEELNAQEAQLAHYKSLNGQAPTFVDKLQNTATKIGNSALSNLSQTALPTIGQTNPDDPKEMFNELITNAGIGVATEGLTNVVGKVLSPGSVARRANISNILEERKVHAIASGEPIFSGSANEAENMTMEEMKQAAKGYSEHLDEILKKTSPDDFIHAIKTDKGTWNFVPPDMSKWSKDVTGMTGKDYAISKMGSFFEKLVPGSHIVRNTFEMNSPGKGKVVKSMYDVLLGLGFHSIPALAKTMVVSVPATFAKFAVDTSVLHDIRRVTGQTVKGDVTRKAAVKTLKSATPVLTRTAQGLTSYNK